jgi:hypothetical protein
MACYGDDSITTDAPHLPVDAASRGKYRVWRADVERIVARVDSAHNNELLCRTGSNFVQRQGKGRIRALAHMRRIMENDLGTRFVDFDGNRARWAYLRTYPGEIVSQLITIDKNNCGFNPWVIAFTDHALQRALQRSAPDLTALVWEAVKNTRLIDLKFLAAHEMLIVYARTWLAAAQMSEVEEAQIVKDGETGERFGDIYDASRAEWSIPPLFTHPGKHVLQTAAG